MLLILFGAVQNQYGQTPIYTSPGETHQDTDGPEMWSSGNIDITGCSSISFSMNFMSAFDWAGSGNMESLAECGSCLGDIFDSTSGDCEFCWDFFFFEFSFNGSVELTELIGAGYNVQTDSWNWVSECLDVEDNYVANLDVISQTWAGDEFFTFNNISILCWEEPEVTFDPSEEACVGEEIMLEVGSEFDSPIDWSGAGGFSASGNQVTVSNLDLSNDGTYTVTVTDENGCTSSTDFAISVLDLPVANTPTDPITACDGDGNGEATFDLNAFEDLVNGGNGDFVDWYFDLGDVPNSPINDPFAYNTASNTIYATVDNGDCISEPVPVVLEVTNGPSLTLNADDVCENETIVLTADTDPQITSYTWDGPPGSGVSNAMTPDPTIQVLNALVSATGMYTVTVDDGMGCTSSSSIMVNVFEAPTAESINIDACNVSNYDLSQHDDDINNNTGTAVTYYDGNPAGGGTQLPNPADLSGVSSLWAVSDNGACTNSVELMLAASSPSGMISGGGTLCPGYCTDSADDLTLQLDGGTPPYDVDISISVFGISTDLTFPAFLPNGSISLCVGEGLAIPGQFDFDGDGDDDIVVPNLMVGFSVSLESITDSNGCTGNGSGTISYNIGSAPNANDPDSPFEQCSAAGFNLTGFDSQINGTATIEWYENMDLSGSISNPSNYMPGSTPMTVYAVANDGTCPSQVVELELVQVQAPELDPVMSAEGCVEFEIPTISGNNLGNNITIEGPSGMNWSEGDMVTESGTYTITAGSDPSCMDIETFNLTILQNPEIIFPIDELTGCGSIELPIADVMDLDPAIGFVGYFSGPFATGNQYFEGDFIPETDGITMVYLYAENNMCFVETQILLNYQNTIIYDIPTYDAEYCGSVTLELIGSATSGVMYFTQEDGGGIAYNQGETLTMPGSYTLYVYDPTLPTQDCLLNANAQVSFEILPQADIDDFDDEILCEGDSYILSDITGQDLTGDEAYFDAEDGQGNMFGPGDSFDEDITLWLYSPGNECADQEMFSLSFVPGPNAGEPGGVFEICEGSMLALDFNDLIGGPDQGGDWLDQMNSGANLADPSSVDFSSVAIGEYIFEYSIVDPNCGSVSETILVTVVEAFDPGIDGAMTTVCNNDPQGSVVDFEDAFGVIIVPEATLIDNSFTGLLNENTADFFGFDEGTYVFTYNIQGVSSDEEFCPAISSIHTVNVVSGPNAGDDNSIESCSGAVIDLGALLSPGSDQSGVFSIDGFNVSGPNGDMWDTGNADADTPYDVEYIVGDPNAPCGADTSNFTITLVNDVTAGTAIPGIDVCVGEEVSLFDFLDGESGGGVFVNQSNTADTLDGTWVADATTSFEYLIEPDTGCNGDSELIFIEVVDAPVIENSLSSNFLCEGECAELEFIAPDTLSINYNFENTGTNEIVSGTLLIEDESFVFHVCAQGNFMELISADSLNVGSIDGFINIDFFNAMSFGFCNVDDSQIENFVLQAEQDFVFQIEETLCPGEGYDFNGETYFESTSFSGQTVNGCDSIVFLDLNVRDEAIEDFDGTFCDGLTVSVGDTEFAEDTQTTILLQGASQFGCDSTINVDIRFEDASYNIVEPTICIGDTFSIEGVDFYDGFEQDDILLPGGSVANCDSIISVTVSFYDLVIEQIMEELCLGDTLVVGDTEFFDGNTTGVVILEGQSINGCDSLVEVFLDFMDAPEGEFSESICLGDTLEVEGVEFYDGFESGIVVVPGSGLNGCDSVVNVSIEILDAPEGSFEANICAGDTIEYQGNQYFEGNLTDQVIVADPSGMGCDSVIQVEITVDDAPNLSFTYQKCEGDTIYVSSIDFEITDDNLSGVFTIPGLVGCDTMINYMTINSAEFLLEIDTIVCEGESVVFGDMIFDETNPTGSFNITSNGGSCDTLVNVNVDFEMHDLAGLQTMSFENQWELSIDSNVEYQNIEWSSSSGNLSCNDCTETSINITQNTTVTVDATTVAGCMYSHIFDLGFVLPPEVTGVYFPNIFSPDGDGFSDEYYPLGTNGIEFLEFYIYDRWGNRVYSDTNFTVNDPSRSWDGTFNGEEVLNGVYVGWARYMINDTEFIKAFDITVIR